MSAAVDMVLAALASGGIGGAIGFAIRTTAKSRAEAARIAAEQDAHRSQTVLDAYAHARKDLDEAKRLYSSAADREADCLRRVESLRGELEAQGRECDQRMTSMQIELDRWRDAVSSIRPSSTI
jgi:hypothetical protein